MRHLLVILFLFTFCQTVPAQDYHAIQGSPYAGSLGVANNPASIVHTPYAWDINVFSFQEKHSTNAVTVYKYSLISSPANSEYLFTGGDYSRFMHVNYNVNLLNTRIAINRRKAIAFGINLRGYSNVKTDPYNFIDTLKNFRDFFSLNDDNRRIQGDFISSSWIEIFGTYSQIIWDRSNDRLNAGITMKVSRGISGAHAGLQNVRTTGALHDEEMIYLLESATAQYGYSSNYDFWKKEKSTTQNLNDFLLNTEGGASIDIGVEYIIKPQYIPTWEEDDWYDYDWKIGLSLLDLGINQYKYGVNSRRIAGINPNISDTLLDQKFSDIPNMEALNDSLAGLTNNMGNLRGKFSIMNPARVVLNVDRYISGNFFINADLSVNLGSLAGKRMYVSAINLLSVTPRWETQRLGFYMPILYNTKGKLWVGGAVKLGPLLFGIHNWSNVFSKKKIQNGGGYLALVIRPKKTTQKRYDKRLDCPE